MSRVWRYWAVESVLGSWPLVGGLVLIAVWAWIEGGDQSKFTHFFINVILVVALQMFSGNSGILSFGTMAFVGTGAYLAGLLTIDPALKSTFAGLPHFLVSPHWSWLPALLAAAAAAGVVAAVSSLAILRLDGASAVIAILALLLIADIVFTAWTQVTRGAAGLYPLPSYATVTHTLVMAVIAVVIARLFKDSRTGLLLQASREDAFSAASVGVAVRQYRARAWILSGMLAGAGGALFGWWITTVTPANFFLEPTFALIVMFIVGGTRTVGGAVIGAALVTVVQEGLRNYEDRSLDLGILKLHRLTGLTQFALVLMILVVMYFRREGILGRRELDESLRSLTRRRARAATH
jgi:branched-chain amino acid transport system ATP-binding protein/branched-chain amino acid transport system permease protein